MRKLILLFILLLLIPITTSTELPDTYNWLKSKQNIDGSFGSITDTSLSILALNTIQSQEILPETKKATEWLLTQNLKNNLKETAFALLALSKIENAPSDLQTKINNKIQELTDFLNTKHQTQKTLEADQLQIVIPDAQTTETCTLRYLKSNQITSKTITISSGIYTDENIKSWFDPNIPEQRLSIDCSKSFIASLITIEKHIIYDKLIIQEKHTDSSRIDFIPPGCYSLISTCTFEENAYLALTLYELNQDKNLLSFIKSEPTDLQTLKNIVLQKLNEPNTLSDEQYSDLFKNPGWGKNINSYDNIYYTALALTTIENSEAEDYLIKQKKPDNSFGSITDTALTLYSILTYIAPEIPPTDCEDPDSDCDEDGIPRKYDRCPKAAYEARPDCSLPDYANKGCTVYKTGNYMGCAIDSDNDCACDTKDKCDNTNENCQVNLQEEDKYGCPANCDTLDCMNDPYCTVPGGCNKCNDCGGTWYDTNICDQIECEDPNSCSKNTQCYFQDAPWPIGGTCKTCPSSCTSITDEDSCNYIDLTCPISCIWENNKCINEKISDTDEDGIPDIDDKCPTDACPLSNSDCCLGCPNKCGIICAEKECTDNGWVCQPDNSKCPSEPCSNNQYCEDDNYCIPPDKKEICSLDPNGLYGFCEPSGCPTSGFNPNYCNSNPGCTEDADRDGIPNILDCNDIDSNIGQCTGCAKCSVDPKGNSDTGRCIIGTCASTKCETGCSLEPPAENLVTYKKNSIANTCNLNGDIGICSNNQCEIKTSIYNQVCDPDDDDDGICDSAYPFENVCTAGPDKCLYTKEGQNVDIYGCSDSDSDGIPDDKDKCPDTLTGCTIDSQGCSKDDDNDGVCNELDNCANTISGCRVDKIINSFNLGCSIDSDTDVVCDGIDKCSNTPFNCNVDDEGCPDQNDPLCSIECTSCEQADTSNDCYSCRGPCYWSQSAFVNECKFCTYAECDDYDNEEACNRNNCVIQDCDWINNKCCLDTDDNGLCDTTTLGCTSDSDCAIDELCRDSICIKIQQECTSDSDCSSSNKCKNNECVPISQPEEKECTSDDDCASNEECKNNKCILIPSKIEKKGLPWWLILLLLLVLAGVIFLLYKKGIFKKKQKPTTFPYRSPMNIFRRPPVKPPELTRPIDIFRKPLTETTELRKQIQLQKPKQVKLIIPSFKAPVTIREAKTPSETMKKLSSAFKDLEKSFKKKKIKRTKKPIKKITRKKS